MTNIDKIKTREELLPLTLVNLTKAAIIAIIAIINNTIDLTPVAVINIKDIKVMTGLSING